jgi:hypothetical protein
MTRPIIPAPLLEHPVWTDPYRVESANTAWAAPSPVVGDETWREFRAELEIRPERGFAGLDFHVQNDGSGGANLHFYTSSSVLQAGGRWGSVVAWKLLPEFPISRPLAEGQWMKFRLDVGERAANIYLNDEPQASAAFDPLPCRSGGLRPSVYDGAAAYRNLRVTALDPGSVKPALPDPWAALDHPNAIRRWQVAGPFPAGCDVPPEEWLEAETDRRGVLNLTAIFPRENTNHVAWARTILRAEAACALEAYVTYTDRFRLWCNGKPVFEGKPRGWFDPDREQLGNSRLVPDQFPIELPLDTGENVIQVRSEASEPFGWGFWMRTGE